MEGFVACGEAGEMKKKRKASAANAHFACQVADLTAAAWGKRRAKCDIQTGSPCERWDCERWDKGGTIATRLLSPKSRIDLGKWWLRFFVVIHE